MAFAKGCGTGCKATTPNARSTLGNRHLRDSPGTGEHRDYRRSARRVVFCYATPVCSGALASTRLLRGHRRAIFQGDGLPSRHPVEEIIQSVDDLFGFAFPMECDGGALLLNL